VGVWGRERPHGCPTWLRPATRPRRGADQGSRGEPPRALQTVFHGLAAVTISAQGEAPPAQRGGLPCLNSHNCIREGDFSVADGLNALTGGHRRTAAALGWNVAHLAEAYGLERLGFLTLTFRDHVVDAREAQERLRSLRANVLAVRYPDGHLRVLERQKSLRVHYHLLVVMPCDIRTGVDFEAIARKEYSSAGVALRSEWAWWRRNAAAFGFGRCELLPVRSTSEGIAKYVGKYISKHIEKRIDLDKGVRLVAYSKGARHATTRFSWASKGSAEWRRKVATFVGANHAYGLIGEPTFAGMREVFGPRWCYRFREQVKAMP